MSGLIARTGSTLLVAWIIATPLLGQSARAEFRSSFRRKGRHHNPHRDSCNSILRVADRGRPRPEGWFARESRNRLQGRTAVAVRRSACPLLQRGNPPCTVHGCGGHFHVQCGVEHLARLHAGTDGGCPPDGSIESILKAARAMSERAVSIEPSNRGYWRLLADLCDRTGQYDRANAIAVQWLGGPPSVK